MKKILLLIIFIFITGCTNPIENISINSKYKSILAVVNQDVIGKIDEYTIYGKWFNLKGSIDYSNDCEKVELVLKSKSNELVYNTFYEKENNRIFFKTNEHINEGINLEKIDISNYVILLKITNLNSINYYTLKNDTIYKNVDYYTITKNNRNNYINILYSVFNKIPFFRIEITEDINKKNICDIVIDPGHGGNDSGATNGKYLEKDLNLLYAKMLQIRLENMGLKVKMTRESDTNPSLYGKNSRTGIPYECMGKLMLSIHLNSTSSYIGDGGFELYMANGSNTKFAKIMASNIVTLANTKYSPNNYNKIEDGVYIRTYSKSDIDNVLKKSIEEKWTMYEKLDTNTTYYYFIRETGGIITNAITDGRNYNNPGNPYYNSNHGIESYLLELGYISSAKNLEHLINEKSGYIDGIMESIKYYITN